MSRSRLPMTGTSTVSISAWQPASSARATRSSTTDRSRSQYSWNQVSAPTFATSSSRTLASVLTTYGTPAARAASAAASSPSGCTSRW